MKNSAECNASLKKLTNTLKRKYPAPPKHEPADPATTLILGCLSEFTTEAKARTAWNKIRVSFVDYNELRVSRPDEVVDILGKGFPKAMEVAGRVVVLLKQIYDKYDTVDMSFMGEMGKRDAKTTLEKLENITPYVIARVLLFSLSAHAFPVHAQMLEMLQRENIVDPQTGINEVQSFLERQINARNLYKTYYLLRRHADAMRSRKRTASAGKAPEDTAAKTSK